MSAFIAAVDPVKDHVDAPQPLGGAYRGYAVGLLLAISIINYLDRQVVHILAEPIKNDLGLADRQLSGVGLLTALLFWMAAKTFHAEMEA